MKAEQLLERRKGIGGSDVAPILGLSPWKTAHQVWEDKTGVVPPQEETPAMAYGKLIEPVLRQWYADSTGRKVLTPEHVLVHPKHDFVLGLLDGMTEDGRVIEIKTARSAREWGEPGTDQIPVYYQMQVQQYLMVTGFRVADVVVSFAGSIPAIYEVPADQELQEMILEEEIEFWRKVQERIPPEPVSYQDMLSRFGRSSRAGAVIANEGAIQAVRDLKLLQSRMKVMESEEAALKALLMGTLKEDDILESPDGAILCTWKLAKAAQRFDAKALQADDPETYAKYLCNGQPSRRFLIK